LGPKVLLKEKGTQRKYTRDEGGKKSTASTTDAKGFFQRKGSEKEATLETLHSLGWEKRDRG